MESMITHEASKLVDYLKKDVNRPVSLGRSRTG
jgi:hypothetical protein